MDTVNEADWKLFKEKLPVWQENYMARINKKLVSILSDENLNAGDRFWKAEKLTASFSPRCSNSSAVNGLCRSGEILS